MDKITVVQPYNHHPDGFWAQPITLDGIVYGVPYHADGMHSPYLTREEILNDYVIEGLHTVSEIDYDLIPQWIKNNFVVQERRK